MRERRPSIACALVLAVALSLTATAGAADPAIIEGQSFTGSVAVFAAPNIPPGAVTIAWGDGVTVPSFPVTRPDGKAEVTGTHTYARLGSYQVKVTDDADATNYQLLDVTVKDAPISASGATFPVGSAATGVTVASIADANPIGVPTSLKADIDWGDGSPTTPGTISAAPGPAAHYVVQGSHAYPDAQTYLVEVHITSADGGDAAADVQSTADGVPVPGPPEKGRIFDLGGGDDPSLAIDDKGTAHVAWSTPHPGRTGADVVYCQLPRGARACKVVRRLVVDALASPVILRDRSGALRIVVSYNGTLQLGGGTLVVTSQDDGATWSYAFYRVNTGLFQGQIIDATLSLDGRILYALFGDFVFGDKLQTFAEIGLDRPILDVTDEPGRIAPVTGNAAIDDANLVYSARTVGLLTDGRVVLAGYDTRAARRRTPRAAIKVVADADGNPLSSGWSPIRGGEVHKIAGSQRATSILTSTQCEKGVEISAVRGVRLGPPRPLGADRFLACNRPDDDLFVDTAGGRHVVFPSDHDGCQGPGSHGEDGNCLIYRRARPGGDFGPKTTIANTKNLFSHPVVAAAADGSGWVAWNEQTSKGSKIKITPTFTSAEDQVDDKHLIALSFTPGSECAKKGPVTIGVKVSGPQAGLPKLSRVTWSTTLGLLPRRNVDAKPPYSDRVTVDRRLFYGVSSTGTIVFTMTVKAKVQFRTTGRATHTANLSQVLSFFCGVPFSKVR
jgi:hypothetical protein